jgi:hypothetical protein
VNTSFHENESLPLKTGEVEKMPEGEGDWKEKYEEIR